MQNDKPTTQEIVQRYLPEVQWTDEAAGFSPCPGKHKHTVRSTNRDCKVYINGTPTVFCLHSSCQAEVAEVNSQIRTAWGLFQPEPDKAMLEAARAKAAKKYELEQKAKASLPEILKTYKWDVTEIDQKHAFEDSFDMWLWNIWGAQDVIWNGNPEDSGFAQCIRHFKTPIELEYPRGNYSTASTYKEGSFSRCNANVLETKYLIVEGDKIHGEPETEIEKLANKDACGAVFNWLRTACGLSLRAVVDSGNKSLHGWFDMPSSSVFEELKVVLPALGCDRAMFKPSQPARIPGVVRDNGNQQKLLWIK